VIKLAEDISDDGTADLLIQSIAQKEKKPGC